MRVFALFAILVVAVTAWADDNAPAAPGGLADASERVGDENIARNYIPNGGFDDPAFQQRLLKGYDGMDEVYECTSLPGWSIETASLRNGIVQILPHDDSEGNAQYVRFYHYTLDGWARITLTATVSGLEPGREYVLDMCVCHSYENSTPLAYPDHGFKIYGKGGELLHFNNAISTSDEWQYLRYAVIPDDDEITIELWSQNFNGDGNKSGVHTVSWDQVRLYDPQTVGIVSITSDKPAQIYTLQGLPVSSSAPMHGIYLVKRGSQVKKVLY